MRPIKMIEAHIVEVVPVPSYEPPIPPNLPPLQETPSEKIEPLKCSSKPNLLKDVKIWLAILLMIGGVFYGVVSKNPKKLLALFGSQQAKDQRWINGRWEGPD